MSDTHDHPASAARVPAVSVIIPAYGVNAYIEEAVDSVLAQTFTDVDLYVVNDGAPADESAELRRILARYGDRIIYLEREHGGPSAARNGAIRATRSPFVAFLDGDDYWDATLLEREMALFASDPALTLVYADAHLFGDGADVGVTYMHTDPSHGEVTLESLLALRCNIPLSTVVARRDAVMEAGWFDESLRYSEDYDLWLRMAQRGLRMTYLREPLAYRRLRESSASANTLGLDRSLLVVLDRIAANHPLTTSEHAAYKATYQRIHSGIAITESKLRLSSGNFAAAAQALGDVDEAHRGWKLRVALIGLTTVPRAFNLAFRWWTRFQQTRVQRRRRARAEAAAALRLREAAVSSTDP